MKTRNNLNEIKDIEEITIGALRNKKLFGKKTLIALQSEYGATNSDIVKNYCYTHDLSFENERYQHIFIDAEQTSTLLHMNITEDTAFYHRIQVEFHDKRLQYLIALPMRSSIETFQLLLEIIKLDITENYLRIGIVQNWSKELLVESARLFYAKRIFATENPNLDEVFNLNFDEENTSKKFKIDLSKFEDEGLKKTFQRYFKTYGVKKLRIFLDRFSSMNVEALYRFTIMFREMCIEKEEDVYLKDIEALFNDFDEIFIEDKREEYQILEELKYLDVMTENAQLKSKLTEAYNRNDNLTEEVEILRYKQTLLEDIETQVSAADLKAFQPHLSEVNDENEETMTVDDISTSIFEGELQSLQTHLPIAVDENEEDEETRILREEARTIFNS